jgi:hypothetical protein
MAFSHNFLHAARYEGLFEQNPSQPATPVTLHESQGPETDGTAAGKPIAQSRQSTPDC